MAGLPEEIRSGKIVDIKLGYSCNNDCIHCVIAENRDDLIQNQKPINRDFEECKKEILDAIQSGAEKIVLTGGEPTLRNDLFDLLSLINDHPCSVNIQTNGRAFRDMTFARRTIEYQRVSFSVALHGPKSIHDKITRREGSFNDTVNAIKNLIGLNKPVSVKFVISKLNYTSIEETVDILDDLKVKHMSLTFPHGIGNAGKYFADVVPQYTEIIPYLRKAFDYCNKKMIWFDTEAIPYCFLEGYEERASEAFLRAASIETRPVGGKTLNWSKKRPEIKQKGEQCCHCLFDHICEGFWEEYGAHYGFSELKPVHDNSQYMMKVLTKYKKIKDFRSGKSKSLYTDSDK
ncbi:MAG: radical SAM protein [Candidatus Omnitrophota bacterium]